MSSLVHCINRVQPVGTVTNERISIIYRKNTFFVLYCPQYKTFNIVLNTVLQSTVLLHTAVVQCSVSMVIAVSMNTHRCIKNTAVRIFNIPKVK